MKRIIISLILIIIVAIGTVIWWKNGTRAVDTNNNKAQIFIVEKGAGVREVANSLKSHGLIRDPIIFFLLTKRLGIDKEIQAGDFRLNPTMDMYSIIENLQHGTLDIWVTVPEGLRAAEINELLKAKMPTYDNSWKLKLENNEGYLFPDTYLLPRDADIDMVINIFRKNFDNKFATLNSMGTTVSQERLVIIASLIEREARHDEDRPLVASVITNRLGIGMKLDIDATLQYALGYQSDQKRWWKKSLTNADKLINSPYNTYRVAGLPPTPISNPGLASLKAAINPASTSYLFYITDKNGVNRYAKDLDGHNANILKYGL